MIVVQVLFFLVRSAAEKLNSPSQIKLSIQKNPGCSMQKIDGR
jgi:hypothetical protein